jgi:endonuclease G, mitochondrial
MKIKLGFFWVMLAIACFSFIQSNFNLTPASTTSSVIKHKYYSVSYNEKYEQAEWIAYKLTSAMIAGYAERKNNFKEDPLVSTGSASLADYKGSGYDRGHLCPAADMKISQEAMNESFYMSNMSPQDPSFNRGIWKSLEEKVRSWAATEKEVYVVTGGVLTSVNKTIGANQVGVPQDYYKIIYDYSGNNTKMIGFILPNKKGEKQLPEYVVPVNRIETITGIDFFPQLPDDIEEALESKSNYSAWVSSATPKPNYKPSQSSTTKSATAQQCNGIASSTGVRCKSKTKNSNGYCHHHQRQVK